MVGAVGAVVSFEEPTPTATAAMREYPPSSPFSSSSSYPSSVPSDLEKGKGEPLSSLSSSSLLFTTFLE